MRKSTIFVPDACRITAFYIYWNTLTSVPIANTTRPDLVGLVFRELAASHNRLFLGSGNTNQKQQYAELAEAWRVAKQRAEQMEGTDPSQPPNRYFGDKNPFDSLPPQPSDRGGMF